MAVGDATKRLVSTNRSLTVSYCRPRACVRACSHHRYRFASPAEARERAKATLLDPGNSKEHVRLTYMMECICVLRMCRQVATLAPPAPASPLSSPPPGVPDMRLLPALYLLHACPHE